ncbi:MAG: HD domain-containing protein [Eubacterium sp.]|nr:HD domain-containing protein [Eubacterium sp.]
MKNAEQKLLIYICSLVESRDFSAEHHCEQIRRFTEIILDKVIRFCPEYGLTEEQCRKISYASATHDIGKLSIPDRILNKPGRLTEDEFMLMKNHTMKGKYIFDHVLNELDEDDEDYELLNYCREICLYHHERFDGEGYPERLKGNSIPISAQVVGLVDAYDALVSDRIYKPAFPKEEAFEMIVEGECGVFNPRLIEIFRMVRMELEEILEQTEGSKLK